MWSNDFHYRWNSTLFAAPGYVVAMVNFRGSVGYGQEWTDAVSRDWGGGPYQDLLAAWTIWLPIFSISIQPK
jgi:dipeptidyl aminopeptidase/acylaminoacyl peptidase